MMFSSFAMFPRRTRVRRGFTLIEAALVTVIIGVGVMAMLQLLASGTVANNDGQELTTGMNLAKSIRELALGLNFADPSFNPQWSPSSPPHWGPENGETIATFNDVDDLDGQRFSPPIDARRASLGTQYANWEQRVAVHSVDPDRLTNAQVGNGTTPAIRVTVSIYHNGNYVCNLSWLRFDTN